MVVANAFPLAELKKIMSSLDKSAKAKLTGELLTCLVRDQGPKWVKEKWDQSGLQWCDVTDETATDSVNIIIKDYVCIDNKV